MQDDQRAGVDIEALTAEIDHRLKDADAALARDYPGERGRAAARPHRLRAGRPGRARAAGDLRQRRPRCRSSSTARSSSTCSTVTRTWSGGSSPSWSASRSRTCGSTSRTGTARGPTTRRTRRPARPASVLAQWIADGDGAAVPRDPVQEPRAADPEPRAPHPGALPRVARGDGGLPDGFVVTLPKVTSVDQVEAMTVAAECLEKDLGLPSGALRFELQVETPQAVLGSDGTVLVARMIHAVGGPLHRPPLRHLRLLRRPRHRPRPAEPRPPGGRPRQGRDAGGGRRHRRTPLRRLHQPAARSATPTPCGRAGPTTCGWSGARWSAASTRAGTCTPRQLPTRYAATFAFFRSGLEPAVERLRAYRRRSCASDAQRAGPSTRPVLDEPATARALAAFLLRGLDCGALSDAEVVTASGLNLNTLTELAGRPVEKRKAG